MSLGILIGDIYSLALNELWRLLLHILLCLRKYLDKVRPAQVTY